MGLFDKKKKEAGRFLNFILLNSKEFDINKLVSDLKSDWDINIENTDIDIENKTIVTTIDGMMATISLLPAPIPNDEAVYNAKTNYYWSDAVTVAQEHKAHILVAVLPHNKPLTQAGITMVKLSSSCLKQNNATAINTLGTVLAPNFYIESATEYIGQGLFPILNLVFFGLYSKDGGKTVCGYTYGMNSFGKDELEIINSQQPIKEVRDMLTSISCYVIEDDVLLKNGETIGYTAEQKLTIKRSKGKAINGHTLKIGF